MKVHINFHSNIPITPVTVSLFKTFCYSITSNYAGSYLVDLATKDHVMAICEALPEKKPAKGHEPTCYV